VLADGVPGGEPEPHPARAVSPSARTVAKPRDHCPGRLGPMATASCFDETPPRGRPVGPLVPFRA
jgi:hypothetical protein